MIKKERPPFAKRLIALRNAAGLSQAQLAAKLNMAASNIAFWELTGTPPRGEVLPDLAKVLSVSVDELLVLNPLNPNDKRLKERCNNFSRRLPTCRDANKKKF